MSLRSLSFGLAIASADAANYAVIAAGSKYYSNYRHQADACHAYQVLRAKGTPAENIILMMYDDVASSPSNPFPGKLFNKPATDAGKDVYDGCNIDYRGADVTPATFTAVLTGTASGRKLESTADDEVFIFFVDHGAPGLIAFPDSQMHKTELQSTLQQMRDNKMFKKLTFYLETCESGSMFEDMNIPNVYAVSAANPTEASWGTYCGADAKVGGTSINSCLGDLFSVSWMEDSEANDVTTETLDEQYTSLVTLVSKSHVMQWGDTSFTSDDVSDFIGSAGAQQQQQLTSASPASVLGTVSTRFVHLANLYSQYQEQPSHEMDLQVGVDLHYEITQQLNARAVYGRLVELAYSSAEDQERARTLKQKPDNAECEMKGLQAIRDHCAPLFTPGNGFALQFHQQMVNVCYDIANSGLNLDIEGAAQAACQEVGSKGFAAMQTTIV